MVSCAFDVHIDVIGRWMGRRKSCYNHCTVVADVNACDVCLGHEHYFHVCHIFGIYRFVSCGVWFFLSCFMHGLHSCSLISSSSFMGRVISMSICTGSVYCTLMLPISYSMTSLTTGVVAGGNSSKGKYPNSFPSSSVVI